MKINRSAILGIVVAVVLMLAGFMLLGAIMGEPACILDDPPCRP